jgi:hypothetical protein
MLYANGMTLIPGVLYVALCPQWRNAIPQVSPQSPACAALKTFSHVAGGLEPDVTAERLYTCNTYDACSPTLAYIPFTPPMADGF